MPLQVAEAHSFISSGTWVGEVSRERCQLQVIPVTHKSLPVDVTLSQGDLEPKRERNRYYCSNSARPGLVT